jgi:4-amino-4-deoxy-L-arabinose transferase-like glycosyltransferase
MSRTTAEAVPQADTPAPEDRSGPLLPFRWVPIAIGVVLAVALVLRFVTTSDLWLDEALTANIAQLPLGDIPDWLRHDGAPPLSYVLLRGWTEVFGTSDLAVRSLSGIFSIATLPAVYFAGRRMGGRQCGWVAVIVLATSAYAIRFATEARMYSLVALLVVLGYLALQRAREDPSLLRLALLALVVAALLYTQYWALYLVAVAGGLLVIEAVRAVDPERRHAARAAIVAFVAGGILFLPWVSAMLYQQEHTGTPWGDRVLPHRVFTAMLDEFAGGTHRGGVASGTHIEGYALFWLFAGLMAMAVFAVFVKRWRYELDLRTRPGARIEALVWFATVFLGALASYAAASTFQPRYASVVHPLFVLVVSYGVIVLRDRWIAAGALALVVVLGFAGGIRNVVENRTQGGEIGRVIASESRPGDVVVYCPDQLGPATSRGIGDAPGLTQMVFPTGERPELVDWVDYEERNQSADPQAFAQQALDRLGPDGSLWFVFSFDYIGGNEGQCEGVRTVFDARSTPAIVVGQDDSFESMELLEYPAP